MSELLENAMLNYYKNTSDFDNFKGVDMVPENHHLFKKKSPWGPKLDTSVVPEKSMKAANCENNLDDGSTWSVSRIGPFRTTGGYDWVQVGWDNLWDLRALFSKHPEGIYVLEQFSGPVAADGTRLGHPPIHVHHMHIGPSSGVRQRSTMWDCLINADGCYDPTRVFEHHGDYQCPGDAGGLDCWMESAPEGYGKLLTFELGLEGDLNDVRPVDSPVMEWYYELGARWVPKNDPTNKYGSTIKAMSFHNFAGPGTFDVFKQSTYIFTYQQPTDQESIFWYSGRMHHSAKLLRNKQHAHNAIFDEAIFFSATPEELGLTTENKLVPSRPYNVIPTSETGFSDNSAVKSFIMSNLQKVASLYKSPHRYDRELEGQSFLRGDGSSWDINSAEYASVTGRSGPPRAICQAIKNFELVDGLAYDRREPMCCAEWDFNEGEVFTVVSFGSPVKQFKGETIPPTYPGHIGYWLSYDTRETPEQSHFSIIQYGNNPDRQFSGADLKGARLKFSFVLFGGTPSDGHWILEILSFILFVLAKYLYLWLIVFVALLLGVLYVVAKEQNKAKRRKLREKICTFMVPSKRLHEL